MGLGLMVGAGFGMTMSPSRRQVRRVAHKATKRVNEVVDDLADAMGPVSYTHLDVYKRQFHGRRRGRVRRGTEMFRGKKYQDSAKLIDRNNLYDPAEAMDLVVKTATAKFDETVELHVKLGVDSRHADQQVRGAIVLPHGTGKTQRVLVFAKGDKADLAREAGADYVGDMDMVEKIQKENWFDFDVVVASPDMMGVVAVSYTHLPGAPADSAPAPASAAPFRRRP